jgi:molybdopterin-guanine dinucleotide biosynthesis protein A
MGGTTGSNISRTSSVAGDVLAGGRSKRFGQGKARVRLGGEMMLTRTRRLVREVSGSVRVVADREPQHADSDVSVVEDLWPDEGSLGGTRTSLKATAETDGGRGLEFYCEL